jgi:hypothetical protein
MHATAARAAAGRSTPRRRWQSSPGSIPFSHVGPGSPKSTHSGTAPSSLGQGASARAPSVAGAVASAAGPGGAPASCAFCTEADAVAEGTVTSFEGGEGGGLLGHPARTPTRAR